MHNRPLVGALDGAGQLLAHPLPAAPEKNKKQARIV